ncbi:MAG: GyrI-like domain-containing protein [Eubacteriales bacterium]|nr:GyrI-like domain-containing protein [Eubacteriales bacterium]
MEIQTCVKEQFSVIGIEGSTADGQGFVRRLWDEANARFGEVAALAKRNEQGDLAGVWGVMSDFSRSFLPWQQDFSQGLYLAGIEAADDSQPPAGWTKWIIPAYEYRRVKNDGPDTFARGIAYLRENQLPLAGAVHEFTCARSGETYLFFPVCRL